MSIDAPGVAALLNLSIDEVRTLEIDNEPALPPIVERLRRQSDTPLGALHRLVALYPDHPESNLALGMYSSLSGEAAEGLRYLERADTAPTWVSDSMDAVLRYMYVDCSVACGTKPSRTFGDLISLPLVQAITFGIVRSGRPSTITLPAARGWSWRAARHHSRRFNLWPMLSDPDLCSTAGRTQTTSMLPPVFSGSKSESSRYTESNSRRAQISALWGRNSPASHLIARPSS